MDQIITFPEITDAFGDSLAKKVKAFVSPIIGADHKGLPNPIASTVLLRHCNDRFLLTATHVLKENDGSEGTSLYGFVAQDQLQIEGPAFRVGDPYDISLIKSPALDRVPLANLLPVPSGLALDAIRDHELCLVFGFPARSKAWRMKYAEHRLTPEPFVYLGVASNLQTTRFSVRFSPKRTYRGGQKLPRRGKLNGISGGGVFVVRDGRARLAGTVIEYISNRAEVICTSALVIWSLLRRAQTEGAK